MIKQISIHNFQSHKDSALEFSPHVNTIIGQSDSGKTAILRALNWLATNRPAGDAFRSDWGGDTIAEIATDTCTVSRVKGDKKNSYFIIQHENNPETVADEFKAMGQSVPDEVLKALNLTDINTQYQMDSPFLLSSDWSPGRVAEYLNEVAGLDAIDRATTNINAKLRKLSASQDAEVARLADVEAKYAALDYVDAMDNKVKALEDAAAQAARVRTAEQELNNLVINIKDIQEKIAALPDYERAEKTITELMQTVNDLVLIDDRANKLNIAVTNMKDVEQKLAKIKKTTRAERLLNHVMELQQNLNQDNGKRIHIEALLAAIYETQEFVEHNAQVIKVLNEKWKQIAPDVCPLCDGTGRLK